MPPTTQIMTVAIILALFKVISSSMKQMNRSPERGVEELFVD